jgi:O-antigen/teichoic acid export membrane protein
MESGSKQLSRVIVSRTLVLTLAILTQIFLAWQLGPAGVGSYAISIMFAALLSVVFVIGCDVASSYLVSAKVFNLSEGITYTLVYGGIGSAMAIAMGVTLLQFELPVLEKVKPIELYIILISIPTTLFSTILLQLYTAIQDYISYFKLTILQSLLQFFLTILLVWEIELGVEGALYAILASGLLTSVFALIQFKIKHSFKLVCPQRTGLLKMFEYGKRYYLGKMSNTVNAHLGTLILAIFMSREQVGIFSVAIQLTTRIMVIPDTLFTVLAPKAASDKEGRKELIAQSVRLTAVLCGILLLFLYLLSEPIVLILYSPKFIESAFLVDILCAGVFIRSFSKIIIPYLLGINHPGIASISVAAGVFINIVSYFFLLPKFGLTGAVCSVVLGYFISSLVLIISFINISGISFIDIFLFKKEDLFFLSKFNKNDNI